MVGLRWPMVAALMLTSILTLTGCERASQNDIAINGITNKASAIVQRVEVMKVVPTDNAYRSTTFFGNLISRRNIPLAFTQGGRVATINVSSGQQVVAGKVLARTDVADLDTQKSTLQNSIENLSQSINNPQQLSSNSNSADLRNQVADLQRQLDEVNRVIADREIRAPFDGVVAKRNVDVGQVVSAGMPIFDLVDSGVPLIEAQVATGIANRMSPGESVWVLVATRPYLATVTAVLPTSAQSNRTRTVTLEFAGSQAVSDLNPGDAVEIRYWTQTNRSGFWLPYAALQRQSAGLWSALVVESLPPDSVAANSVAADAVTADGLVRVKTVEVIHLQDDLALVSGAFEPTDRIIVSGLNRVVPGQRVNVRPIENNIVPPGPLATDPDSDDAGNGSTANGGGTSQGGPPIELSP